MTHKDQCFSRLFTGLLGGFLATALPPPPPPNKLVKNSSMLGREEPGCWNMFMDSCISYVYKETLYNNPTVWFS